MLWLTVVEWLARFILIILIGLSVWSVSIMIERRKYFKTLNLPGPDFKKSLSQKTKWNGESHFFSDLIKDLNSLKDSGQMDKFYNAYATDKRKELDKGLPILATLGSTTPFIGLLGTILGIIVSFGELSRGTGSTNSVMFSLAEALILTAVGLVVAIPAVIAFNIFNRKVRMILAEGESLKDLYIAYKE
jgi:biopolymer transport protein ExbB